ncbi:sensor histidine kinase [Paenibacillaceae bacterium WGS1546]|uniref:sensor histidine kinase n=1 Tax=Cohnella sp. WGS1546 TaxID=3366810 RepID=UPI00372D014E
MRRFRPGWSSGSLQAKLVGGVLVLTIPLILVMIVGSYYAINVVRTQVSVSYQNLTTLYMRQIDAELDKVDKYLNGLVGSGMELFALNQAKNDDEYYRAKISFYNSLRENLMLHSSIHAFFMYSPDRQDFMPVQSVVEDYRRSASIHDSIAEWIAASPDLNGYHPNSWTAHEIDGEYYIFHIMKADSIYFGAWQKANSLMVPLNFIRFGDKGGSLFATSDGIAMTNRELVRDSSIALLPLAEGYQLSGEDRKFLIVGEASRKGDISLIAIIPDDQILENLPYLRNFATFAPLASLLIIPLGLFFLRKIVLLPINRLLLAMKRIREGNLSVRIEEDAASNEFQVVNQTFNGMMGRIQGLTVNVYEEQLNKQREELQRLQLQLNPHFFLNSLNIIYHLAKVKDYELIKEMSQCLVRYFRFMFRSNLSFVHMKDELEHTANYLRIQELRFPGQLVSRIEVSEYLLGELVPPLIVHTFVENTIKHAVTLDQPIELDIRADIVEIDEAPFLKLAIEDTGEGFPEEILARIQANQSLESARGEHTGIWNVQRRLKLLYGDEARIAFANRNPRGAAVRILLPVQKVEMGREREEDEDVQFADRR